MSPMQACLFALRHDKADYNLRWGTVKLVQACLSDREDRESSFYRSGSPVSLVQACLCAGKG